jgi:transposase
MQHYRLESLAEWLQDHDVTQVVLEATGQYWKPIWYVLEERGLELLLVNARHVKLLPPQDRRVRRGLAG